MIDPNAASIDAASLYKGQSIPGIVAWNHFSLRHPDTYANWLGVYGDEETARAHRLPQVLVRVRDWLERERQALNLPPLVMNTTGGCINVLTDERASTYLNDQAFQGLRRHTRATNRLINAVDETQLSASSKREHQNRINTHSFIAAGVNGAQKQLRLLKKAGKQAPRLEGD